VCLALLLDPDNDDKNNNKNTNVVVEHGMPMLVSRKCSGWQAMTSNWLASSLSSAAAATAAVFIYIRTTTAYDSMWVSLGRFVVEDRDVSMSISKKSIPYYVRGSMQF